MRFFARKELFSTTVMTAAWPKMALSFALVGNGARPSRLPAGPSAAMNPLGDGAESPQSHLWCLQPWSVSWWLMVVKGGQAWQPLARLAFVVRIDGRESPGTGADLFAG